MDMLLRRARALYTERQRIAIGAIMIAFAITTYVFYRTPLTEIPGEIPVNVPEGWVAGFEVVYSFNTAGFILAVSVMLFFYAFWTWAFLPTPATIYTMGVLRGIFGSGVKIQKRIGRRFRVVLDEENNRYVDITCRMREPGTDDWFVYTVRSGPVRTSNLEQIALRHGLHVSNRRLCATVNNDELHSRLVLLATALAKVR